MPEQILDKVSTALSQSMYLPAVILLLGVVASALFIGHPDGDRKQPPAPAKADLAN